VRFDGDEDFQARSRQEVVRLQGGDAGSLRAWAMLCDLSRAEFQKIYDLLGVKLIERGESFYNPLLPDVLRSVGSRSVERSFWCQESACSCRGSMAGMDARLMFWCCIHQNT
jgi:arginyl-tRNA synthetase